jgi:hypothetical protein
MDDEINLLSDTLETLIRIKKTKFYIKILVNSCSSSDPECFMLSNDNYFKLDFETLVSTANPILSDAFLNGSNANASGSNVNAPGSNANASSSNANAPGSNVNTTNVNASTTSNPSNSFEEFKKRIIEELTKALTKEYDFDKFKKRIIEELTKALTTTP